MQTLGDVAVLQLTEGSGAAGATGPTGAVGVADVAFAGFLDESWKLPD